MNKKPKLATKEVISTLLILTTFTVITSFATTKAYAPTEIFVYPPSLIFDINTNGTIGTPFNITMKVQDVTDLCAFQVDVLFNDTCINVTRWYEPTWDPEYVFKGKSTMCVPFLPDVGYESIGPGNASARVSIALFPPPSPGSGFAGDGVLCIIEFKIIAAPPEGEFYSKLNISMDTPYSSFVLDCIGGEMSTGKENGEIWIIPEFSPFLILPILMVITLVAIAFAKNSTRKSKSYRVLVNN